MIHCKKASFSNEAQAQYYLDKLERTSIKKKFPVRAYLCEKCFTWHLTSIKQYEGQHLKQIEALKKEIERMKVVIENQATKIENQTEQIKNIENEERINKILKENKSKGKTIEQLNTKIANQRNQINKLVNAKNNNK